MLEFDNVTKEFQLDEQNTIAPVKDITLTVDSGELIVIIGRSGTGKTTLLNLTAGLIRPTRGRVIIDGKELSAMTDKQVSRLRSQKIGFIFQFPSLLPSLSILENVSLPSMFNNTKEKGLSDADIKTRAEKTLDTLGLASKYNVFPKQLSAGEQKRVVIARSLINEPRLILADEPTSDLDNRTETEVLEIIKEINKTGVTFIIATHNLGLVQFADRAFEMDKGSLNRIEAGVTAL